jgi:hypothetical protein
MLDRLLMWLFLKLSTRWFQVASVVTAKENQDKVVSIVFSTSEEEHERVISGSVYIE